MPASNARLGGRVASNVLPLNVAVEVEGDLRAGCSETEIGGPACQGEQVGSQ